MSIFRDSFVKESPIFTGITRGVGGFGCGASGAASGAPSADPPPQISSYNDLFSNQASQIEGALTHNGYGFMLYTGYKGNGTQYSTDMDVTNISKIRFVLMGGGGGATENLNIITASGSGGIEGWIDTSNMTTLRLKLGVGGGGRCSGNGWDGGASQVERDTGGGSYNDIATANGGKGAGVSNYTSTRPTTSFNSSYVNAISRADGSLGGESINQISRQPSITLSPTLSGAHAHGACSGAHATNLASDNALGYGGGGPGTYGYGRSPGGPLLSYAGGLGDNSNGTVAEGPSVNNGTAYGKNSVGCSGYSDNIGGGGGGCFGAPGMEIYDVGQGASGLVKVWWASNTGDVDALTTVGNLYT